MIPDPVKAAIAYLLADPDLDALGARISGDLRGYEDGMTWLTVSSGGGRHVIPFRLAAVTIDLNAYAPGRPEARELAATGQGALWRMRGLVTSELVVTAVELGQPPQDLTDNLNQQHRFVADATVYVRPR